MKMIKVPLITRYDDGQCTVQGDNADGPIGIVLQWSFNDDGLCQGCTVRSCLLRCILVIGGDCPSRLGILFSFSDLSHIEFCPSTIQTLTILFLFLGVRFTQNNFRFLFIHVMKSCSACQLRQNIHIISCFNILNCE